MIVWLALAWAEIKGQFYDPQRSKWTLAREQVGMTLGVTAFLGDLGGANAIGSDGLRDMNLSQVRWTFSFEYRYFVRRNVGLRGSLLFAQVAGDDAETKEPFRRNRNLHFKSPIIELSGMVEYFILREEPGRKGTFVEPRFIFDLYAFAGIGGFYFNPKAQYQGQWLKLQPLGTEGQGLELQPKPYSRVNIVVPMGFGFAKRFKQYWSFGMEFTYRLTFTDYLDDVSTVYFDKEKIRAARGDAAAYLADPSLGYILDAEGNQIPVSSTVPGYQRGDPNDNDAFLTAVFTAKYYLAGIKSTRKRYRRRTF